MGVTVVLARYLGAESYGIYQRSEAFVLLFSVLANLGLDMILTREVARDRLSAARSFWVVALCKVVLSAIALAAVLWLIPIRGYEGTLGQGIRLFGILLLVNAFVQSADAVLQGLQAMRDLAFVTVFSQVVWSVGALYCVWSDRGLLWIIGFLLVSATAHLGVSLLFLRRRGVLRWNPPQWARARYFLREAVPLFLFAAFSVTVRSAKAIEAFPDEGEKA